MKVKTVAAGMAAWGLALAAVGQGFGNGGSLLEPALTFDEAVAAAQKGEARGYYQLAIKFSAGEEVTRNRATGMAFLAKAVEMGHANALFVLGRIKELRIKETKDPSGSDAEALQVRLLFTHGLAALTGAYFWDGESTATTFADTAAVNEVSNLYARAVAGGVVAAEKQLADFLQKKKAVDEYDAAVRRGAAKRKVNDARAAAAFADMMRPEFPSPALDKDSGPLYRRDPNAYLDAAQANDAKRGKSMASMRANARISWRRQEEQKNDELRKRYANLKIESVCGIKFGEKPPAEWKPHHQTKLAKKFRFFDSYYVELTADKRVCAISLNATLSPSMKADDIEAEKSNVVAALEKRYNFRFPREADGTLDDSAFNGSCEFGRYKIMLHNFDMDGTPGLSLIVKDLRLIREDAEKKGVPKTLPPSEGLDAL